jgi:hypothetical protein
MVRKFATGMDTDERLRVQEKPKFPTVPVVALKVTLLIFSIIFPDAVRVFSGY